MNSNLQNVQSQDYSALAGRQIILFDGVCGLCDHFVQVVLDHDPTGIFHFSPLQGNLAHEILAKEGLSADDLHSVYLVRDFGMPTQMLSKKSNAALDIFAQLDGPISLLKYTRLVPTFIRDAVYRLVANNRYKIFGKLDQCRLPQPEQRARFVDI